MYTSSKPLNKTGGTKWKQLKHDVTGRVGTDEKRSAAIMVQFSSILAWKLGDPENRQPTGS